MRSIVLKNEFSDGLIMRKTQLDRLPSLRSLQVFAAAARHESFTEAAKILAVTPGAVSRQVQDLERELGRKLFVRNGPNISLTQGGRDLAAPIDQSLSILEDAVALARVRISPKHVTVSMLPSVAAKWLAPRLGDFISKHPEIDLRVGASRHLVDFVAEDVDCAIRYGAGNWPGVEADHIGSETVFPVCTPEYAKRFELKSERDLLRMTLIHSDIPENWRTWFAHAGMPGADVPRGPLLADDTAMLQAVLDGHGVALGRSLLVQDDVDVGRLIAPFDTKLTAAYGYWFVTPERKPASIEIEAVKAWIFGAYPKPG